MANIYQATFDEESADYRRARLGDRAGCDHLGLSLYELAPAQGMVFHYHLQNEELVIVVAGRPSLRTGAGWRDLDEGEVVSFRRGVEGAHGFENRTNQPVRLLVLSEMHVPNVSLYPDSNQVGIYDAARPPNRRFGALFDLADAVDGYGGGKPVVPPPTTD